MGAQYLWCRISKKLQLDAKLEEGRLTGSIAGARLGAAAIPLGFAGTPLEAHTTRPAARAELLAKVASFQAAASSKHQQWSAAFMSNTV